MKLERWGWYSVLVNVLLAGLHGLIAWMSGSLAVFAELVHNLIDLLGAVAVLLGIRLAERKSRAFPYGLYKIESLVAVGLAGLVLLTAYEIARDAVFTPAAQVRSQPWMFALLVITTALPLVFSRYELRAGLVGQSAALAADAREYRIHAFVTGLAIIGLASQWLGFPVDRCSAGLIVLAVLKTAWDLLGDAMRVFANPHRSLERGKGIRVAEWLIAQKIDVVLSRERLHGRGPAYVFRDAGVELRMTAAESIGAAIKMAPSDATAG